MPNISVGTKVLATRNIDKLGFFDLFGIVVSKGIVGYQMTYMVKHRDNSIESYYEDELEVQ